MFTMPVLTIITNIEKSAIPEKFLEEATESFAQAIGKPKEASNYKSCRLPGLGWRWSVVKSLMCPT